MREIKRYESSEIWYVEQENYPDGVMINLESSNDGEFVKYTDHKAVVETMQKRIDELEELNKSMRNCHNCGMVYNMGETSPCNYCIGFKNWVAMVNKV